MAMTTLSGADLEALATQCRDPSFRAGLDGSPLWGVVASTLQACLDALDASFIRSGGDSSRINGAIDQAANGSTDVADDDEDDGLSYSFSVRKDASMDDIAADSVTIEVKDAAATAQLLEQATSAFRFLRNACAASATNQDACRESKLLHVAHDLVMRCCLWSDVEESSLSQAVVLLSQVALQFSVNAVTGHVENQEVVWSLYFPDDFQKVFVECQEHRKIVAFTAALMLNCINKTLDDEAVSKRRVELIESRNVIITLLQRCLTRPSGSQNTAMRPTIDEQDPAFEWLCLVFKVLFETGYSKHLYNAVGAHMLSKLWSRVTPEQLILLRMFTMWMTSHRASSSSSPDSTTSVASFTSAGGRRGHSLPVQDEAAFEVVFEFVTKTFEYMVSQETEDRPEEADETRKLMWVEFENEAKMMLLDVVGELTLMRVATPSMRELMEQLLRSMLQELERVWQLRRLGATAPPRPGATGAPAPREAPKLPATEPFGYRSAIIRSVGNLTYRHSEHQDFVREGGFLPLFLNHCNIDEANPLLREWSLVALRNLCEGNEENQAYINALRPQGIDRASVNLDNINVDATLGEDGKVRVTRKEIEDSKE